MEKKHEFLELESLLRQVSNQLNTNTRRYLAGRGMTMARFWVINKLSPGLPAYYGRSAQEAQSVTEHDHRAG